MLSQQIKKHFKKEIRTYLKEVWERIKPKENESPSGEVNVTLPVSSETEHDSFEKKRFRQSSKRQCKSKGPQGRGLRN